jgi:hypothetical protein
VDAMTQALLRWNIVPRDVVVVCDRLYVVSPI